MPDTSYKSETGVLIRKPISEVFQAFVNPAIKTQFWFTKSSGPLVENQKVEWTWEMYNHSVTVNVVKRVDNQLLRIQWGNYSKQTTVDFDFQVIAPDPTFVSIVNYGFQGSITEIFQDVVDATVGFTWVLT